MANSATLARIANELYRLSCITDPTCISHYVVQCLSRLPTIWREKSLRSADAGMAGRAWTFRPFGHRIVLEGALFGGAREIYCRQVYFALPDFLLKPGDIVVDLGANAGIFTILAAQLAKKVVAVEAQAGFVSEINANARRNHCHDKIAIEFGLVGPRTGVFSDPGNLKAGSHFGGSPNILSMNDLIVRHSLEKIDFLKVDIEGSEFSLLECHTQWLSRVTKMVMEVHLAFGEIDRIVNVLKEQGFIVGFVDNNQRTVACLKGDSGYLYAKRNSPLSHETNS